MFVGKDLTYLTYIKCIVRLQMKIFIWIYPYKYFMKWKSNIE